MECSRVEHKSRKRNYAANEGRQTKLPPRTKNGRNEKKLGKPVAGIAARAFACHTRQHSIRLSPAGEHNLTNRLDSATSQYKNP